MKYSLSKRKAAILTSRAITLHSRMLSKRSEERRVGKEDVIEAVTEALQNNGFFLSHICGKDEFGAYVSTELFHESGFTLQTKVPVVLSKQDMQVLGSAITYARRYGILSILNLPTEDDDGNDASRKVSGSTSKPRTGGNVQEINF